MIGTGPEPPFVLLDMSPLRKFVLWNTIGLVTIGDPISGRTYNFVCVLVITLIHDCKRETE